ncbi:MAG: hypothetical protein ACD_15C00141G0003 [uncultured bacterium]|nr:MAG: hypothetical protein ACD_15C00141G0003 [uncultured bacterium]
MRHDYKKEGYGCPIGCKYCVVTKVDSRRKLWNKKTIVGLNKAVTIFNPPPNMDNKNAMKEFYSFPLELFKGDIVGFNAISDPFWPRYKKELDYFLKEVSPIAKLVVCVTKFNLSDSILEKLSHIKNFRLTVSITGLDQLENTKTKDRLDLLKRAKQYGIAAFPIIHPYIAEMSNLSFLSELKKIGYNHIDVKGLRYNHEAMKGWMPIESQKYYLNTNEKEILPEDGWREKIKESGLEIMSLKDWYQNNLHSSPSLDYEESKEYVNKILKYANMTSSDTDEAVIKASVLRRM